MPSRSSTPMSMSVSRSRVAASPSLAIPLELAFAPYTLRRPGELRLLGQEVLGHSHRSAERIGFPEAFFYY
ncbi:hypothetical protein EJ05DRAFT_279566 [Pseudovirgaria hyperparasitica]|uniref:Uncharacterized protein n=1 Tax=Pseudovirgaria hyperparasitica TaxID=470096 RepID=A0A6A6WEA0_9PEZI|nr:uncharacterized protein EJ05DRAFT_279566 [Pseudovirgaria hyperparasitica]KAF2760320.1 hypothetical protein EJ05DRAFT_279566 [Pseudovirgaria hyperparasitica]